MKQNSVSKTDMSRLTRLQKALESHPEYIEKRQELLNKLWKHKIHSYSSTIHHGINVKYSDESSVAIAKPKFTDYKTRYDIENSKKRLSRKQKTSTKNSVKKLSITTEQAQSKSGDEALNFAAI